jgi:hypothetical protein
MHHGAYVRASHTPPFSLEHLRRFAAAAGTVLLPLDTR